MLRNEAVQDRPEAGQTDPHQSQVHRTRRNAGHEGPDAELPRTQGGGLRSRPKGTA